MTTIKCSECGEILTTVAPHSVPRDCPICGSSKRTHLLEIPDTIPVYEILRNAFYMIKVKLQLV